MNAPNRNIFWAKTFVDELARCGLEYVCIAPGSRSTPLVIAFAENPHIKVYSHIDERSCAFFALGLALATDKPVAILCSSGTATANFYPAIIEARYSNVPLIVLTADRQHELRESGANQTVDQVKLYGDHVLWFYDAALPEVNPPAVAIRNLRTLADRAYAKSNGIEKGPVHINFPFRKPLEPIPVEDDVTDIEPYHTNDLMKDEQTHLSHRSKADRPVTLMQYGQMRLSHPQVSVLFNILHYSARGIIVCGPRTIPSNYDGMTLQRTLTDFALAVNYPIFADPLSGLRFEHDHINLVASYDTFLQGDVPFEPPNLVLHFGAMPASSALESYLNNIDPTFRVLITPTGTWTDPYHRLTHVFWADPLDVCSQLLQVTLRFGESLWVSKVRAVEEETRKVIKTVLNEELFDGSAIAAAVEEFQWGYSSKPVFVASSLAIRHLEQYALPEIHLDGGIFSNRGASGIDGTISSAMGVAASLEIDRPVLLITGDLAFYHDMNGLLAVKRCNINNIIIVLINNDGGGIFQRLPISQFDPPFTELFLTPHGLDFEPAIRMYGLDYHRAESLPELRELVKQSVASGKATVIEVRTDSKRDLERREEINRLVQEHLQIKFQK